MKKELFNLHIGTLDDKVLYQEICRKISESDAVSFRLLVLVPLVSSIMMLILLLESDKISTAALLLTGSFGSLITYFIYRWEIRNIQTGSTFRKYACLMEARKQDMEVEDSHHPQPSGPYSLLHSQGKPHWSGKQFSNRGWGKIEAETAIYLSTMVFWLLLPLLAFLFP